MHPLAGTPLAWWLTCWLIWAAALKAEPHSEALEPPPEPYVDV